MLTSLELKHDLCFQGGLNFDFILRRWKKFQTFKCDLGITKDDYNDITICNELPQDSSLFFGSWQSTSKL